MRETCLLTAEFEPNLSIGIRQEPTFLRQSPPDIGLARDCRLARINDWPASITLAKLRRSGLPFAFRNLPLPGGYRGKEADREDPDPCERTGTRFG
ncbi:hypothetical protein Pla52o_26030 [Novipirellula galeiformis]|uniref:Uncharacterized protein n=1 Tax=Novipirellula galeiformis TaxID=2528004 RepID=A0A5C6CJS9_9BACT|nr:hypothetical protein Pla52o_26030 [Novipirellula galeiformis]